MDINSNLDYLLIYHYLFTESNLPDNFYYDHMNSLKIKFTSNAIGGIFDYRRCPLYLEIPSFANSDYIELMIPNIIKESKKHYNTATEKAFWNLNSSFRYYRNKFVYDFISKYDTERKFEFLGISERTKFAELIIREHFDEEYSSSYYSQDNYILDEKEFTNKAISNIRGYERLLKTKKLR